MQEIVQQAVTEATVAGADYADARMVTEESESLTVKNQEMEGIDRSRSEGIGIRVLVNGYWRFAAIARATDQEAARTARLAVAIEGPAGTQDPLRGSYTSSSVDSATDQAQRDPEAASKRAIVGRASPSGRSTTSWTTSVRSWTMPDPSGRPWALSEVSGSPGSLNRRIRQAPVFYGVYVGSLGIAAALVLASTSLVRLAVGVEIMNALLLPVVLGFLVALAWTALPPPYRLGRIERVVLLAVVGGIVVMGLVLAARAVRL